MIFKLTSAHSFDARKNPQYSKELFQIDVDNGKKKNPKTLNCYHGLLDLGPSHISDHTGGGVTLELLSRRVLKGEVWQIARIILNCPEAQVWSLNLASVYLESSRPTHTTHFHCCTAASISFWNVAHLLPCPDLCTCSSLLLSPLPFFSCGSLLPILQCQLKGPFLRTTSPHPQILCYILSLTVYHRLPWWFYIYLCDVGTVSVSACHFPPESSRALGTQVSSSHLLSGCQRMSTHPFEPQQAASWFALSVSYLSFFLCLYTILLSKPQFPNSICFFKSTFIHPASPF